MSGLDRKLFSYFSDIKFVLISEISVQMESACGFKEKCKILFGVYEKCRAFPYFFFLFSTSLHSETQYISILNFQISKYLYLYQNL